MTSTTIELSRAVVRLQAGVLAIVFASIGGVALFIMTAWLLVKGGQHVGLHLRLLEQYFPGYSVTWKGSLIGACYGVLLGGSVGWAIGIIYNKVVALRSK
jgi:hypothetical protein